MSWRPTAKFATLPNAYLLIVFPCVRVRRRTDTVFTTLPDHQWFPKLVIHMTILGNRWEVQSLTRAIAIQHINFKWTGSALHTSVWNIYATSHVNITLAAAIAQAPQNSFPKPYWRVLQSLRHDPFQKHGKLQHASTKYFKLERKTAPPDWRLANARRARTCNGHVRVRGYHGIRPRAPPSTCSATKALSLNRI